MVPADHQFSIVGLVPTADIPFRRDRSTDADLHRIASLFRERRIGALFEMREHGRANLFNLLVRLFELAYRWNPFLDTTARARKDVKAVRL
jgi:hypothetical protein